MGTGGGGVAFFHPPSSGRAHFTISPYYVDGIKGGGEKFEPRGLTVLCLVSLTPAGGAPVIYVAAPN